MSIQGAMEIRFIDPMMVSEAHSSYKVGVLAYGDQWVRARRVQPYNKYDDLHKTSSNARHPEFPITVSLVLPMHSTCVR